MPGTLLSWVLLQMSGTFYKQSVSFFGHTTDNTSKCSGLLTLSLSSAGLWHPALSWTKWSWLLSFGWKNSMQTVSSGPDFQWRTQLLRHGKSCISMHLSTFKSPECPNFPPAKTDCKLPILLLRSSSSSFILDHFALHKLNKTNSCIYAKANLSFFVNFK